MSRMIAQRPVSVRGCAPSSLVLRHLERFDPSGSSPASGKGHPSDVGQRPPARPRGRADRPGRGCFGSLRRWSDDLTRLRPATSGIIRETILAGDSLDQDATVVDRRHQRRRCAACSLPKSSRQLTVEAETLLPEPVIGRKIQRPSPALRGELQSSGCSWATSCRCLPWFFWVFCQPSSDPVLMCKMCVIFLDSQVEAGVD